MSVTNYPLITLTEENDFRELFERELLNSDLRFKGYKIVLIKEDFEHACFERAKDNVEKGKFGIRRARRILLIKSICEDSVPYRLFWQNNRQTPTLCVLCVEADCALYFKPRISNKDGNILIFQTLIAFGEKVEKRIKKQTDSSLEITDISEIFNEAD